MNFCFFFAKNLSKILAKTLRRKYSLKRLDHAKQYATDAFKTISKTKQNN